MAAAAPFFREFDPPSRGVRLLQPEVAYAHPLDGGRAAIARRSLEETAEGLGPDARGTAGCSRGSSSTATTSSTSS